MSDQPHSAEFFGEQRDFWWNRDFLALMATRWRLHEASSLADIGHGCFIPTCARVPGSPGLIAKRAGWPMPGKHSTGPSRKPRLI